MFTITENWKEGICLYSTNDCWFSIFGDKLIFHLHIKISVYVGQPYK